MEKYLLIAGLLLNSGLITFNRFIKRIPDGLYITGLILGIGLILAAAVMMKR